MPKESDPRFSALWRQFDRYFDLSLATTEEQKRAVYELRYRVFCESCGFEDPGAFEDHRETDGYDDYSLHCLVTHRATGQPAGCVRLVTVDAATEMPIERLCAGSLDPAMRHRTVNRRSHIAEVSRLAVGAPFTGRDRGFSDEQTTLDGYMFSAREQRTFPLIHVALMCAAGASADLLRRTECFFFIKSSLRARLRRAGVTTTRVGDDVEFNGTRTPYLLDIDEAVGALPNDIRSFYNRVRDRIEGNMSAVATREPITVGLAPLPAYPMTSRGDLGLVGA